MQVIVSVLCLRQVRVYFNDIRQFLITSWESIGQDKDDSVGSLSIIHSSIIHHVSFITSIFSTGFVVNNTVPRRIAKDKNQT